MLYDLPHVRTRNKAPIEVESSSGGDVRILASGDWEKVPAAERATAGPLHKNHFATCPAAASFGKGKGKK